MGSDAKWTLIEPLEDANHGTPTARSSHGLTSVSATQMILYGGEFIARTPLPLDQILWSCEWSQEAASGVDDAKLAKAKDRNGYWSWRAIIQSEDSVVVPTPRVGHAQAVVGKKLYIMGGRTGPDMGGSALDDMWYLDLETEKWQEVSKPATDSFPETRSFHTMTTVKDEIYVFGGCGVTSGRLSDLHKFRPSDESWTSCGTSLLQGRGGPNVLPLPGTKESGILAVVAGFCGFETNDGHVYDLGTQEWNSEKMKGLEDLRPRSVCVSGFLPSSGVAVIFGGEVDPSDRGHEGAGGFEQDLILLDKSDGRMLGRIEPKKDDSAWPDRRGWSSGTVRTDKDNKSGLYVFGGLAGDDENPIRLGDFWKCEIF